MFKLIEVTEDTEIFSKSLQWNIMHIYFVEFFFFPYYKYLV